MGASLLYEWEASTAPKEEGAQSFTARQQNRDVLPSEIRSVADARRFLAAAGANRRHGLARRGGGHRDLDPLFVEGRRGEKRIDLRQLGRVVEHRLGAVHAAGLALDELLV